MKLVSLIIVLLTYTLPVSAKLRSVVIDPAAGGSNRGVQTRLFIEKDIALQVAQEIQKHLKKKRIRATLTRFDDYPLTAKERISLANQQENAVWVSLHFGQSPGPSKIDIYTLDIIPSQRRETSFLIPIEKAHLPWISRSVLLAKTLQETLPPMLTPTHLHSKIPIRSLFGVNQPGVMIEVNLETQTMQPAVFQNLIHELSERISIAVTTFIKKERKL